MIDIGKFKLINDTYGHLAGDALKLKLAGRISTSLRAYDMVGRFCGDDFVILPWGNLN
jgi:diguanylate cyclase (GGDEF)-like protein